MPATNRRSNLMGSGKRWSESRWGGGFAALLAVALAGCGTLNDARRERELERVARDWAMTIRASQVIPVYPLTQDLIPGDVFVVDRSVAEQSRTFRERGFLPTDLHIARLHHDGTRHFYGPLVELPDGDDTIVLPRDWRTGGADDWSVFPRAGFPSYSFELSNSGGLSTALPLQGIPIALSVTGAASATGTVTIADAITYGIDADTLARALEDHVRDGGIASRLRPPPGQVWSLRVVTRVFAAKRFDIVLTATDGLSVGVDAGAPQPVEPGSAPLPPADPTTENTNAGDATQTPADGSSIAAINQRLAELESTHGRHPDAIRGLATALPGGSVRATFRAGRTIGFRETYTAPIVVGYHGFDVAIDHEGRLGRIVPTFQVLDRELVVAAPTAITDDDAMYLGLVDALRALEPSNPRLVADVVDGAFAALPDLAALAEDDGSPIDRFVAAVSAWTTPVAAEFAHERRSAAAAALAAAFSEGSAPDDPS